MGDFSDFERGQIIGAHLVGASGPRTTTLLSVLRATVAKVKSAYTNQGRHQQRAAVGEISIDRKRSSYIEKDFF
jgi:hypothetical protein